MRSPASGRSSPGPNRLLDEEQILDTAVLILRRDGVEGLTVRRLAAELGVTPMTLYRYFPSKDALLDAVADMAMQVPDLADSDAPWDVALHRLLVAVYRNLRAMPEVAQLMAIRSVTGPGVDDLRERMLALLTAGGLSADAAVLALGVINRYLQGCAVVEGRNRRSDEAVEVGRLASLDSDRYPTLSALADKYVVHDSEEAGLAGLDMLVAGLRRRSG
jgi:AcrR family transcriptional regulator